MDLATLLERALLGVVAPLWLLAGWLDYACHRRQRIEATAGLPEARLHLLMLGELGVGVLAALFLEINAAVLALLGLTCVVHELTMLRDLAYAQAQRRIPWFEQWVHGLQQALPWVAFSMLVLLHWPQAEALLGFGPESADWRVRWKSDPLPAWSVVAFLAASLGVVLWPFSSRSAQRAVASGTRAVPPRRRHWLRAPEPSHCWMDLFEEGIANERRTHRVDGTSLASALRNARADRKARRTHTQGDLHAVD